MKKFGRVNGMAPIHAGLLIPGLVCLAVAMVQFSACSSGPSGTKVAKEKTDNRPNTPPAYGGISGVSTAANRAGNAAGISLRAAEGLLSGTAKQDLGTQLAATADDGPLAKRAKEKADLSGSADGLFKIPELGKNSEKGGSGGGFGSGSGGSGAGLPPIAATAPSEAQATAHMAEGVNGNAPNGMGGYSGGGGKPGAGGGGFNVDSTERGLASGGTSTEQYGAGSEVAAMGSVDPEDYFTRLKIEDSIFKIVERKYQEKTRNWMSAKAEEIANSVKKIK